MIFLFELFFFGQIVMKDSAGVGCPLAASYEILYSTLQDTFSENWDRECIFYQPYSQHTTIDYNKKTEIRS